MNIFLGFFTITEWDGSTSTCSATLIEDVVDPDLNSVRIFYANPAEIQMVSELYWNSLDKSVYGQNGRPEALQREIVNF